MLIYKQTKTYLHLKQRQSVYLNIIKSIKEVILASHIVLLNELLPINEMTKMW